MGAVDKYLWTIAPCDVHVRNGDSHHMEVPPGVARQPFWHTLWVTLGVLRVSGRIVYMRHDRCILNREASSMGPSGSNIGIE